MGIKTHLISYCIVFFVGAFVSLFFYCFTSGTFIYFFVSYGNVVLQQTRTHILFNFVCSTESFINSKEKHTLCVTVAGIIKAFGTVFYGK